MGEERPDPRRHGARTEPDGAGGERSPRIEMDRQDPDPAAVRQMREPAPELLDLPAPRPRSLGKHQHAVALVQIPRGPVQRFAERAAALHRDEVGEVAEEGALHPVVEEVVGGRQGQQIPSRFPEGHLHEPHVEVGAVIRHHQVVRVVRNVRPAREGRLQHLVVEPVLHLGQRRPPGLGHRGRNLDLFLVAFLPGLAAARTATPDAALGRPHREHQLLDGAHVRKRLGSRRLAELALEPGREFVVHEAVEAQLREGRRRPDLRDGSLADGCDQFENPIPREDFLAGFGGRLAAPVAQPAHELGPLHLAGSRSGKRLVRELDRLDPLVQRQSGRNGTKVGLDALPPFRGLLLRHDDGRHLLRHPIGKSDNGEFGDQVRRGVDLFHLVRVDVLAAAVHDHVLAPADQEEVSLLVETPQVAGVEPAVAQRFRGRLVVPVVPGHDVRTLGGNLADPRSVGIHDADLDPGQRLADAADGDGTVRRGHRQHRGGLREPVALGDVEPEAAEGLPGRLGKRGGAADQVADPASQRGVHRKEHRRSDVDSGVLAKEVRRVDQGGGEVLRPLRPLREGGQDAPPQEVPEGRHSHDAGGVPLLQFRVDGLGADLVQIGDLGAPGKRKQEAGRELERMVEREDAERTVLLVDVVDRQQFGHQRGEIPVRQHHSLGRAGRSGGEEDGGQRRRAGPDGFRGSRLLVLPFSHCEDILEGMGGNGRYRAARAGEPAMPLEQRVAHQDRPGVSEP